MQEQQPVGYTRGRFKQRAGYYKYAGSTGRNHTSGQYRRSSVPQRAGIASNISPVSLIAPDSAYYISVENVSA